MEISREATTIIIGHCLSTITHADQIIVLDQGKIIESEKYNEPLKLDGICKKLWKNQVATVNLVAENNTV